MTCNDSDLRKEAQDIVRDVLTDLDNSNMLTYAVYSVDLVYETVINADAAKGDPGETIQTKKRMSPSPKTEVNTKLYLEDGVTQKMGTARISNIIASDDSTQKYTRLDLEGASYWLIDGSEYSLVEGGLTRSTNGIYWEAVLIRRKQNNFYGT